MPHQTHEKGLEAENAALTYLENKGFVIIAKRFKRRGGEIDLIATKAKSICFIEVRYRKNFSLAAESITPQKQKRLIQTAEKFIQENSDFIKEFPYMCFDVILLNNQKNIRHITNAFEVKA